MRALNSAICSGPSSPVRIRRPWHRHAPHSAHMHLCYCWAAVAARPAGRHRRGDSILMCAPSSRSFGAPAWSRSMDPRSAWAARMVRREDPCWRRFSSRRDSVRRHGRHDSRWLPERRSRVWPTAQASRDENRLHDPTAKSACSMRWACGCQRLPQIRGSGSVCPGLGPCGGCAVLSGLDQMQPTWFVSLACALVGRMCYVSGLLNLSSALFTALCI